MTHIAAEAEEHGCLDNVSAFPFENYLQQVKKMVRSGKSPLVQIVKRLSELDAVENTKQLKKVTRSAKPPNNAYISNNMMCCEVVDITN